MLLLLAPHPAVPHHRPPAIHGSAPAKRAAARPVKLDEIGIEGASTEYDGMAHTYAIKGHVKVVLRDMTVTCQDALIINTPSGDRVDRIIFSGDVVALRGHNTFRGDRVTYYAASRRLVAEGNTRTRLLMPQVGTSSLQ